MEKKKNPTVYATGNVVPLFPTPTREVNESEGVNIKSCNLCGSTHFFIIDDDSRALACAGCNTIYGVRWSKD